jgi:hypothetical protein
MKGILSIWQVRALKSSQLMLQPQPLFHSSVITKTTAAAYGMYDSSEPALPEDTQSSHVWQAVRQHEPSNNNRSSTRHMAAP